MLTGETSSFLLPPPPPPPPPHPHPHPHPHPYPHPPPPPHRCPPAAAAAGREITLVVGARGKGLMLGRSKVQMFKSTSFDEYFPSVWEVTEMLFGGRVFHS